MSDTVQEINPLTGKPFIFNPTTGRGSLVDPTTPDGKLDAHDRLAKERDAVNGAIIRVGLAGYRVGRTQALGASASVSMDTVAEERRHAEQEHADALDALIDAAMALGAEPLVAALEANRKQLGLAYAKMKAYADPSAVRDTAKALDDADAALAATGKEVTG